MKGESALDTLGEKLRKQRENLGMSLDDVEEETKIRKYYISALEEDNFQLLPAMVYASGFVKRYAQLLGLDENEILQEFKRLTVKDEPKEEDDVQGPQKMRPSMNVPIKNLLAGLMFLIVVVWMGSYLVDYLTARDWGRHQATPPITDHEGTPGKNENPPAVMGVNLIITGQELCWIRATVDGELIPDTMLRAGQVKEIKAQDTIELHLGNAGGVKIEYNGEDLGVPGERGKTIRLKYPPTA